MSSLFCMVRTQYIAYQGDFSRTTKGNGLGLSIVKEIMELHKGKVKLLESGENGTVFEVVLSA